MHMRIKNIYHYLFKRMLLLLFLYLLRQFHLFGQLEIDALSPDIFILDQTINQPLTTNVKITKFLWFLRVYSVIF